MLPLPRCCEPQPKFSYPLTPRKEFKFFLLSLGADENAAYKLTTRTKTLIRDHERNHHRAEPKSSQVCTSRNRLDVLRARRPGQLSGHGRRLAGRLFHR